MKQMKCSICKELILEEQKAYIKGKIVCQYCFNKLKLGKSNGKGGIVQAYKNWLAR